MAEVRCRISNEDILEGFLRPKVYGEATANPRFIVDNMEEELYKQEPCCFCNQQIRSLTLTSCCTWGNGIRNIAKQKDLIVRDRGCPLKVVLRFFSEDSGEVIGATMRFRYCFRNKNDKAAAMERSNWFMREDRLCDKFGRPHKTRYVLCKITCIY